MKNFQDDLARQLSLALEKQFDFQVQLDADDETAQKIEHDINLLLREAQKARRVEDERRRVEEESRQLYWFLESIIENVPVMLFVKNAKDLTLELWNRRSEELTGIPREEILGKTGIESFPGEQMEAFNQRDREVLEGKRLVATEEPITTKNGDRWLYTKKIPLLDAEGEPKYLLGISEDITVRRQKERELRAAKDAAETADRAKSDFLANISHELRTPLTLILGQTEKLLSTGRSEEEQRGLEVVARNARVLLRHVNHLLDISRLEARKLVPHYARLDLAGLVRLTASCFEGLVQERRLTLLLELPEHLTAEVDAEKLERVLLNLFSNAFKFTPPGGIVRCTLTTVPESQESPERVRIYIADSGPGVPPALRETIFERFRQGEEGSTRRFGGTGLGLAIAREFITLHRGTITVGDAPEGGALFTVEIPLVAPEDAPVQPTAPFLPERSEASQQLLAELQQLEEKEQPSAQREQPRLLIVEDNAEMSHFLWEILSPEYQVATARDGQEGLTRALALRPDLILSDIMMPRLSGEAFLKALRDIPDLCDIPVVLLTARADDELRVRLLQEGAQDYIVKPFSIEEVRARVKNLVALKRTRDLLQQELASQQQDLESLARELAWHKRELETALDAMRAARDAAERANQMKSNFLSLVSHELRTPLTALNLQLQRLTRDQNPPLSPKQQEIAQKIARASDRLHKLIESLLEFARSESGRMGLSIEEIDPVLLATEVLEELRPRAEEKSLLLSFYPAPDLPLLQSDPRLLRLILVNLLENAIKYTERGFVTLSLAASPEGYLLSVSDSGIGIRAEDQARIFKPFEQLEKIIHKHTPGFGLGLALVKRIVSLLGGQITLTSREGEGSTFVVFLPLPSVAAASIS